jgi:hypothetical protein
MFYVHVVDGVIRYLTFMSRPQFMDRNIWWEVEQEGGINVAFDGTGVTLKIPFRNSSADT